MSSGYVLFSMGFKVHHVIATNFSIRSYVCVPWILYSSSVKVFTVFSNCLLHTFANAASSAWNIFLVLLFRIFLQPFVLLMPTGPSDLKLKLYFLTLIFGYNPPMCVPIASHISLIIKFIIFFCNYLLNFWTPLLASWRQVFWYLNITLAPVSSSV